MSSNVYLWLVSEDGSTAITGNSNSAGKNSDSKELKGSIEVVSWSHGFSQPTTAATKSSDQQATSRANHSDLSFTKFYDDASDDIVKACWTGQQLKTATFCMYRASGNVETGGGATEYLKITMEDVIISHYSISGGGDELPIENITLNYTKIEYKFTSVTEEDGKAGKPVPITHDLGTNTVS
ncbi:MAG TPA: type VI secretion system tube protein Hcp [Thiotrichaceae bacterium]|nr:type VI secretion system tube protein Hcp [Thiotrichaceae bacterium]